MATVTGEPLSPDGDVVRVLEVLLAVYSVAVFATLAAAVGAYYLGPRTPAPTAESRPQV